MRTFTTFSMKRNEVTYILGIESSCDETSAAVLADGLIRSNMTAQQSAHASFGGVVPEAASREHQRNIVSTVDAALKAAQIAATDLSAIAVTTGPGLMGSLHVGVSMAKSMAQALSIPIIGVHHMQAHIWALLIKDDRQKTPELPFLCLTVSGGHTQLVLVGSNHELKLLGETLDDAAGEAFDKAAKMLGLPYPGGPEIDRWARLGQPRFAFGKPKTPGLTFSFSGLKTSILYFLKAELAKDPQFMATHLADLAASVQAAIVQILLEKVALAMSEQKLSRVALAGGVSANSGLRSGLQQLAHDKGWEVFLPALEFTTDNAAMIAQVGWMRFQAQQWDDLRITAAARAPLSD
jgi:N6-L-threonylcarbamoyladenine synthase